MEAIEVKKVDALRQVSKPREYTCPKHGVQQCIGVKFQVSQNGKPAVDRDYCMDCWIELMDRFCCQLTPVEGQAEG